MQRLLFLLIAAFWASMTFLLWRSEYKGDGQLAGRLPAGAVWQRILTAPDDSPMEISWQGLKVGYCRWMANVGEEAATGKTASEEDQPDGQVRKLSGYTVDVEGNLMLRELGGRLRFEFHGAFSTNHAWQTFILRAALRPMSWELKAKAAERAIDFTFDSGLGKETKTYPFDALSNPSQLARDFGVPIPFSPLAALATPPSTNNAAPASAGALGLGLNWEARPDWMMMGSSRVKVYRLEAKVLEKHRISVVVSRVGELLRVELPNEILLVNDALVNF